MKKKLGAISMAMILFCLVGCAAFLQNPVQSIPFVFDEVAFHLDIAKEVLVTMANDGSLSKEEIAKYKPIYNESVKNFKSTGEAIITFLDNKDPKREPTLREAYRQSILAAVRAFSAWKSDSPNKGMLVAKIAMAEGLILLKQISVGADLSGLTDADKIIIKEQIRVSIDMVTPWE